LKAAIMDSPGTGHSTLRMESIVRMAVRESGSAASEPSIPVTVADIYKTHFDFVWRNLGRMGVPPASMDDAAQDVFLVVHRKLAGFQQRSSVKTWLFGIVARVAHDHRRLARRKGDPLRYEEPKTLDALPDRATPGPMQRAEQSASIRLLEELLEQMAPEKREVFFLAELEQMTAPEIGQALGIRLTTVHSRLRAARIEFEEALARRRDGRKEDDPCR
jgi:RNA polymerase sigma-70 factor (ECF subfamily)